MPPENSLSFLLHKPKQSFIIEPSATEERRVTMATATYERAFFTTFSEPHEWWEEYDARREEAYRALVKGKTCLDCGKCRVCERDAGIGYCTEDGEFRYADDIPEKEGMECFAA